MKNGTCWTDDRGELIQAHGGMILEHEGVYYWYGEHKGAPNVPGTRRVDVIGVSCYSSRDLKSWHYEGLVLPAATDGLATVRIRNLNSGTLIQARVPVRPGLVP